MDSLIVPNSLKSSLSCGNCPMALVKDPRSLRQRFAARFGLATKFRSVVPAEAGQCEQ